MIYSGDCTAVGSFTCDKGLLGDDVNHHERKYLITVILVSCNVIEFKTFRALAQKRTLVCWIGQIKQSSPKYE